MNWEKRWSRRTSTRYTSIIGWKLTTMADSWPTMISRKRGIMSFWRVISEAQFLRTEFLRITTVTHSAMLRGRASSWLSVEHIRRVVRVGIVPLRNAVIEVAINQIVLN